jgi:hypothetical protein
MADKKPAVKAAEKVDPAAVKWAAIADVIELIANNTGIEALRTQARELKEKLKG